MTEGIEATFRRAEKRLPLFALVIIIADVIFVRGEA